jgi:phenylalanyl-tRNA synthetase beta chain
MKISYNWLKWYVPEIPEADKLADEITFHLCEIDSVEKKDASTELSASGDAVFDMKVLPDRAHDLLSHQGVAKELSGMLGIAFNDPSGLYKVPQSVATKLEIDIQTPHCKRYMARIVRNVTVGDSVQWVKDHLASIGQRSINNFVDGGNIVMYDCGQPVHVFDLDKLGGEKITVRYAKAGEKIIILGGEEKELKQTDLVIADVNDNAVAIAGVKGGARAEVDANTKNILIEVANFDSVSVRKASRLLLRL